LRCSWFGRGWRSPSGANGLEFIARFGPPGLATIPNDTGCSTHT
jgi:hypothetical protein